MTTNVYFDGFNFYYGAVKRYRLSNGGTCKWMDLRKLCETVYPKDTIRRIRYFTARVDGNGDPDRPERQDKYLRALGSIQGSTVHEGNFRKRNKSGPLVRLHDHHRQRVDPASIPEIAHITGATISTREEKGSDVNLAAYLILDAARGEFETAIIVSDDSDLVEAIKLVRQEFGLRVGILNPHPRKDPRTGRNRNRQELIQACTSGLYRHLDRGLFSHCLLPDPVTLPDGSVVRKPHQW